MDTTCVFCPDDASIEYLLPRRWSTLLAEERDVDVPPDGTFVLPVCGTHLHEMHDLQRRFDEQTGLDLDGYSDLVDEIRERLEEVSTATLEGGG